MFLWQPSPKLHMVTLQLAFSAVRTFHCSKPLFRQPFPRCHQPSKFDTNCGHWSGWVIVAQKLPINVGEPIHLNIPLSILYCSVWGLGFSCYFSFHQFSIFYICLLGLSWVREGWFWSYIVILNQKLIEYFCCIFKREALQECLAL